MRTLPLLLFSLASLLLAQRNSGTLIGVVVDSSDANILGAQVTLTSETTGDARKTLSNSTGNFTLPGVPAGARSDAADHQVNTRFGQLTGARSPRIIQFAISFK